MLTPQWDFQHTLREVTVNRDVPCEVARELISNSYDAGAKNIFVAPLSHRCRNDVAWFLSMMAVGYP